MKQLSGQRPWIRGLLALGAVGIAAFLACTSPTNRPVGGKPAGGTGGSGGAIPAGTGGIGGSAGSGGSIVVGTGGTGGTGGGAGAPAPSAADAGRVDSAVPAGDGGPGALPPITPGPHKVVLLMGDPNTKDLSRSQMVEILNGMKDSHGVTVQVMDSQMARASALADASLIIAGPNNNYCIDTPDPGFKTLPVPIMVSRDCKTTAIGLGMMLNTQEYITGLPVKVNIVNGDHPLAAGLKGIVPVLETRCRLVRGSNLGPDAIKIARAPDDATPAAPDSWAIFAYDKGGMMPGGVKAPAKRIGFFWHRPSAVTPEGRKLFEAAVDWALRP